MSALAQVERVSVQWHLDHPDLADPDRFDRLARALAGDALETAMAEIDDPDQLICIRRLVIDPIRVAADRPDREVLDLLGDAMAGALRQTLARGGDDVVRYRSRAEARTDALVALGRDDRRRSWAWHQVGLWPIGEGPAEVGAAMVEVLGRDGRAVAAVVADLDPAALDAVVAAVGPDRLARLVRLAWPEAGDVVVDVAGRLRNLVVSDDQARWAIRTLGDRALGRRLLAGPTWSGPSLVPLVVLSVLAADPATALAPPELVRGRLVAALALVLARAAQAARSERPGLGSDLRPLTDPAGASPWPTAEPAGDGPTGPPADGGRGPGGGPGPGSTSSGRVDVVGTPVGGADPAAPGPAAPAPAPVGTRRFVTEWAGLLFLLGLVEETGLVERVTAGPLSAIGLRPVLHQVGLALSRRLDPDSGEGPIHPADPALLVWCGLAPGQDPPDARPALADAGWDEAALAAVADGEAERLVAALRQALEPDDRAGAATADLLEAVVRRAATVEADPGWIDVHLRLDQVSTAVRRAGLDLDPGYRPWLGLVVRFLYG